MQLSHTLNLIANCFKITGVAVKSKVVHTSVPSLKEIVVPIPSLEEQERIASILDRFYTLTTDITAGLPAEIEARRKQYEYYRDQLLTFKQKA